jgi:hypothetical protein
VCRFLALDVDGRGWPQVGRRDAVIADSQARLPGLRPCGFHSPCEAAAWSVLAQRLRIVQAARLRAELIARHGEDGAFPAPHTLARADLDLPGRKGEYLRAVAEAALDGPLDGAALRAVDPGEAVQRVQQVKGLGPFAAELVVVRGANAPDALPHHERRLDAEIAERYGPGRTLADVSQAWRPYRTCAARAAHRRDRRPLSPPPPGTLSDYALNRRALVRRGKPGVRACTATAAADDPVVCVGSSSDESKLFGLAHNDAVANAPRERQRQERAGQMSHNTARGKSGRYLLSGEAKRKPTSAAAPDLA